MESILFDNIPTFDEIWERIQETSEFGNATVNRTLFGNVFAERRIILALNSEANVKMWATRTAHACHVSSLREGTVFVVDGPREGFNYKFAISKL
jgi:hypothetical protein